MLYDFIRPCTCRSTDTRINVLHFLYQCSMLAVADIPFFSPRRIVLGRVDWFTSTGHVKQVNPMLVVPYSPCSISWRRRPISFFARILGGRCQLKKGRSFVHSTGCLTRCSRLQRTFWIQRGLTLGSPDTR